MQQQLGLGVRICYTKSPTDTQVAEEGVGGGASDSRTEVPR